MFGLAGMGGLSSRRGRGGGVIIPPPGLPGYNLAEKLEAIRALSGFSALATPNPPVDSGNGGSVTNMSQLTDATNTNGGVFTVEPGNYSGAVTLAGLDQKFRFQSGGGFQLAAGSGTVINVTGTAQRIELEGLGANPSNTEFLGGMYINSGANDIKLKNLKIATYNTSSDLNTIELISALRVLVERCDLRSYRYCLYNSNSTDIILCNSRVEGFVGIPTAQGVVRIVVGTRVVVIDNLLSHPSHHTVRVHKSGGVVSDLVYAARNQLECVGGSFGGGFMMNNEIAANPQCDRCWMVDNTFYLTDAGAGMGAVQAGGATTLVNTGNTFPGGGAGPAWAHQ